MYGGGWKDFQGVPRNERYNNRVRFPTNGGTPPGVEMEAEAELYQLVREKKKKKRTASPRPCRDILSLEMSDGSREKDPTIHSVDVQDHAKRELFYFV